MSDEHLRKLERHWRESGDPHDGANYLRALLRLGRITEDQLEALAYLGHEPSVELLTKPRWTDPDNAIFAVAAKLPPSWWAALLLKVGGAYPAGSTVRMVADHFDDMRTADVGTQLDADAPMASLFLSAMLQCSRTHQPADTDSIWDLFQYSLNQLVRGPSLVRGRPTWEEIKTLFRDALLKEVLEGYAVPHR